MYAFIFINRMARMCNIFPSILKYQEQYLPSDNESVLENIIQ